MTSNEIIYIHPSRRMNYPMFNLLPMGVVGLMNLLRASAYPVRGLNYGMEKQLAPSFDMAAWLGARQPGLICLDLHWYEHSFGTLEMARLCKQVHPRVPVVIGGMTASLFAKEILSDFPEIDFILRGDCEEPIVALAEALLGSGESGLADVANLIWRRSGEIWENERRFVLTDFKGLDHVNIDFLEHWEAYYHLGTSHLLATQTGYWLPIARGCHFNCCYCGGGTDAQRRVFRRGRIMIRKIDEVVEDIRRLWERGVRRVNFSHDPSCLGEKYWGQLFKMLGLEPLPKQAMGMYLELFQLPTLEFLDTLFELFSPQKSTLVFSPLSGDESVRRKAGKSFTNRELLGVLRYCAERRVQVEVFFTANLPFEEAEGASQTIDLSRAIVRRYSPGRLTIENQPIALDPGSPLYEHPGHFGIQRQFSLFRDYYEYGRETPDPANGPGNGFYTAATRPVRQDDWQLNIAFEQLQRFPWHESHLRTMADTLWICSNAQGLLSDFPAKKLKHMPISGAAAQLYGFLKNTPVPVTWDEVDSSWPIEAVKGAMAELNAFMEIGRPPCIPSTDERVDQNTGITQNKVEQISSSHIDDVKLHSHSKDTVHTPSNQPDVMLVMPADPAALAEDRSPPLQALGLGYIGAAVSRAGYPVEMLDAHLWQLTASQVAELIREKAPRILGISVQSRIALDEMARILRNLCWREWRPHLVVLGGHFASVADQEILQTLAEIDCIVRGEGEETFLELVEAVSAGGRWEAVPGISRRENGEILRTPARRSIANLDVVPLPLRVYSVDALQQTEGVFSISSSRGCWGRCSFCASRRIQSMQPGNIWRPRSPRSVVDEIEMLCESYNCTYFQFVDDCFLGSGARGRRRADAIAREILSRGILVDFSIEARADALIRAFDTLRLLRTAGLSAVTLGVESGTSRALSTFNKQTTPQINLEAVQLLAELDIRTDMGFIFFDPYCTVPELRQNLKFLHGVLAINPDVGLPVLFNELLVFKGTALQKRLRQDQLLIGNWKTGYTYLFSDPGAAKVHYLWHRYAARRREILTEVRPGPKSGKPPNEKRRVDRLNAWALAAMDAILSLVESERQPSPEMQDAFVYELVEHQLAEEQTTAASFMGERS